MNQYPKKKFLDTALFAAESASKLIQKTSNRSVKAFKSKTDLVTGTDIASEEIIYNIIKSKYPDHSILAEESGLNQIDHAEYIWIIDPLDGTTNFVHNYPSYAVSIALVHKNKPIVGVVVEMPAMNTYWATDDDAAYCNNKVIKVSKTDSLIQSLLVTGFGYSHDSKWNLNITSNPLGNMVNVCNTEHQLVNNDNSYNKLFTFRVNMYNWYNINNIISF